MRIPFYSTEDRKKIEQIVLNLLGEVPELTEVKEKNRVYLVADKIRTEALRSFFMYVRKQEILDTVRSCVVIYPEEGEVVFNIHKQALMVEKIAVVSSDTYSPLGNLKLIIQSGNIEKFLDWFVPETSEGKVLRNRKFDEIFNL